jgi:autotransporter-associated beta strand protein
VTLGNSESRITHYGGYLALGSLDGAGHVLFGDPYGGAQNQFLETGRDNTDCDFYGSFIDHPANGARRGHVNKVGGGTWTLWGDSTHHGQTIVSGGTLILNGWFVYSSNVIVRSGATLGGKGSISTPVTVEAGGTLKGTLNLNTNLSLAGTSTFEVQLSGPTSAGITVNGGTAALSGSALNLTLAYAPAVGQAFTIVNNTGATLSGQFAQGSIVSATYGGKTYYFRISYSGGDGNDVVLTSLPQGTMIYLR